MRGGREVKRVGGWEGGRKRDDKRRTSRKR